MAPESSKPFSISFGSSKPKQVLPSQNPRKRPRAALEDHDSDEEKPRAQAVTGFDQSAGGAISVSEAPTKGPLVIQSQKNRDWREESRRKRGKNLLPAEVQAARSATNGVQTNGHVERDEVSLDAGLKITVRDKDGDTPMTNEDAPDPQPTEAPEPAQTADEEAISALAGKQKNSTLVIASEQPPQENGTPNGAEDQDSEEYMNEDDRFRKDVASRPDVASLDDYSRIPVEEFGSAMLRGMGWQEGQTVGKGNKKANAPRTVERRPALLGIGAKEVPGGVGEELGAWGKATKGKRKTDIAYNPVVLKNSSTGEMLTEAELEAKKAEANKPKDEEDWRDRRNRNLAIDKEKKRERLAIEDGRNEDNRRKDRSRSRDRRRHGEPRRGRSRSDERSRNPSKKDRSRSSERRRHGSSRRERSRSRERRRDRREYDDYEGRGRDYDRYARDRRR